MKAQRWYAIENGTLYIYDKPYPEHACSVSIVSLEDMPYYRKTFTLRKCWTMEATK